MEYTLPPPSRESRSRVRVARGHPRLYSAGHQRPFYGLLESAPDHVRLRLSAYASRLLLEERFLVWRHLLKQLARAGRVPVPLPFALPGQVLSLQNVLRGLRSVNPRIVFEARA